jgi:3-methylcrotonyl-CoA carboxylase alpha subunit
MIRSLLIANRGEIAVRVARTCRRLGIRTIAVYSDADRDALHVRTADEAIRIGPAAARDSYLRADAIITAAARTGAEAIHPGYGFLSEKPELPQRCAEAGLVWIGPSAANISAMGSKIGAKEIAARAGVASVPGYAGADQSPERLHREALAIGLPVMIKASAGGGGKGMRKVFRAAELDAAIEIAGREAAAAFGDPALLIEKLLLRPRHLEVQVAGDLHGNIVHLFERDCSVQRNHQKVLEEAPAPNLDPAIRAMLLDRAVRLAREIGYDNLGTVEFILEEGAAEPWFLEMNTRLQVEHPVTEAVTGLDLVEWQMRIACGEPLPLRQDEIRVYGHAVEARVTAEEAEHGFRPATGTILGYREPGEIRIDSGVAGGSAVTLFYDSLLAKAIAWGETRQVARDRLEAGLRRFTVLGAPTTLPFLADAVAHPLFADGRATTRFIEEAFPEGWAPRQDGLTPARSVAAALFAETSAAGGATWRRLRGFRVLGPAGGLAETRLEVSLNETPTPLTVLLSGDGSYRVDGPDGTFTFRLRVEGENFEIDRDGHVAAGLWRREGDAVWLTLSGETYRLRVVPAVHAIAVGAAATGSSGTVSAPMPGIVAEVKVEEGGMVEVGQVVIVLESMKLFMPLAAGIAGTVAEIVCHQGEAVAAGARLVEIKSRD